MTSPPPASPPDTAPPGSSAEAARAEVWAIAGAGVWWAGYDVHAFRVDLNEAVRFCREEDAERVLACILPREYQIVCRPERIDALLAENQPQTKTVVEVSEESEGAGTPGRHETQTTSGGSNARLVIPKVSEPRSF